MIERIIEFSVRRSWVILILTLLLVIWSVDSMRKTPLDAIPDLSDPQVIIYTDWMGRSPDLVEDQITYPLVLALQSTPGVRTVRGYSMFGMSFIYALFDEGTDIYWARTRVLEQLTRAQQQLPADVTPTLGPDASGVGWIYQYVLEDTTGRLDLAQLRALQDFTVRPVLQSVDGVAEVATLGGFERQYQVVLDPARLAAFGLQLSDITQAIEGANTEVGARVIEQAGREFVLRGRGYIKSVADLEKSIVSSGAGGTPVTIADVARVQFGPQIRRGAVDWNGLGEAVGGIVVMRMGANALDVIDALEQQIETLALPAGVRLVPTYDRSELIKASVATLRDTLIKEGIIVLIVCMVFLMHAPSALVAMIILPLSVVISFIAIRYLGLSTNIMSLGGIAIAMAELADAVLVMIENAHSRLAAAPAAVASARKKIIVESCKEVGRPIFFSAILLTVSFIPVFTLEGQAGRLFDPLAYTKTVAMLGSAILAITLAPILMVWFIRGRIRSDDENPVSRGLRDAYRPVARWVVRKRKLVVAGAVAIMLGTVPVYQQLGAEFMPPLDEGSLLLMPTTFPGISIQQASQVLTAQHQVIMEFAEVASVHGKAGRAETATDPAQLDMNESVVLLKPREDWPLRYSERWYSTVVPEAIKPLFRVFWPERQRWSMGQLARELDEALRTPGYQMAIAPPIRTRIDMLSTGVRTPVGIKVFGDSLDEIEKTSIELESLLRDVHGTRSTFAERQTGREYIDITPDRDAIARYGLTVKNILEQIELAVGGMSITTVIDGRARYSVNLRFAADYRSDPEALAALLIPVPSVSPVAELGAGLSGRGGSEISPGSSGAMDSGAGSMQMGSSAGGASTSGIDSGLQGSMTSGQPDWDERWRPSGTAVPLGSLASVRVVTGPPMIKNENGMLVGYVFVDIDSGTVDLGRWVENARKLVADSVKLPQGIRLEWTGQYEFMAETTERLRAMIPLTLILIVLLLYLALRGWGQTFMVLLSVPFAVAGSIWLLFAMNYNLSTAVWVGLIAVSGVAAQTAIIVVVYLDQALAASFNEGRLHSENDFEAAITDGAVRGVRPMVMTVATTVLGLIPLLWDSGVGADLSARTAAPVVGGMAACLVLTLLVVPAAYALWRHHQWENDSLETLQVAAEL